MFGVAITTSSICVGARCPWVRPGIGACATQNITDPSIGNLLLDTLERGLTASQAMATITEPGIKNIEYRQLTLIDNRGSVAHYSGSLTLGNHAVSVGETCVAAGNLLKSEDVPNAMTATFERLHETTLPQRLLSALRAGLTAGGEGGPVRSSALLVTHRHPWPLVDLRCDWDDDCPITKLEQLWQAYEPQMSDYNTRALNPATAPAYGVPGNP